MFISPHFQDSDFTYPLSLENKIDLFEDRIIWWKLMIADNLINGGTDILGNFHDKGIHGAGFAVLDIVFSYFELIAKYYEGYTGKFDSSVYFKKGVILVFPNIEEKFPDEVDGLLDILYEDCRCRLYHAGFLSQRITLTHELQTAFGYNPVYKRLVINPHLLPSILKGHFESYICQLRDKNNHELRENFEKRFNCL
jgi:hypothetical protein